MEEFKIRILSEFKAVFMYNNKQIGWLESPSDTIDFLTDEENFVLSCYPITENSSKSLSLPYSAKISVTAGKMLCDCPLITITDYGNKNYVVNFTPYQLPSNINSTPPFYKMVGETIISINKGMLYASSNGTNLCYPIYLPLDDITAENEHGFTIIRGKINNSFELQSKVNTSNTNTENNKIYDENYKVYNLFLNKNLQVAFEGKANKIEFDGNQIVTLNNVPDIARHGIVTAYALTENGFKKSKKYSVYTANSPTAPACIQALPLAFMEALNIENYTLARSYLHPNLSASLKNEHLRAYFGDYVEVTQTFNNTPFELSLVYNGNPRFVKTYRFDVKDNRIFNIDYV